MSGLSLSDKLASQTALAQGAYEDAQRRSKDLKAYGKALTTGMKLLSQALKDGDVATILELEKVALEFDFQRASTVDKTRNSLSILEATQDMWEKAQNPENVIKHFESVERNIGQSTKPVQGGAFDVNIKSMCRKLGTLAGGLTTPAEKAFYMKRQECLKFVGKQYNLTINKHLGRGSGVAMQKGIHR